MNIIHLAAVGDEEPSAADLAAIEEEAPLIAAELDLLDAEIRIATLGPSASALDHRRVRRAVRRVLAVSRTLAANPELPKPPELPELPGLSGRETASGGAA